MPQLTFQTHSFPAAIGEGGLIAAVAKREGDKKTPIGRWPVREVRYRADRVELPPLALPVTPIGKDDGWCDAPEDTNYNRPVSHPYPASAEHLWREDHHYDILVVLGHNDDPVVPGLGSAIFFHLAKPDFGGTAGCVAVTRDDMLAILPRLTPDAALEVREDGEMRLHP